MIAASDSKPRSLSIVCTWDRFLVRASNRQSALEGPSKARISRRGSGLVFYSPPMLNQFTLPRNAGPNTVPDNIAPLARRDVGNGSFSFVPCYCTVTLT